MTAEARPHETVVYWMFRGKIAAETEPTPALVTSDYSSTYPEND